MRTVTALSIVRGMWRRTSSGLILNRSISSSVKWPRELKRVRAAAFPGHPWPHNTWRVRHVVTARVDGRIAGFVMLHVYDEGDVDLYDLAAHPGYQRRDIGYEVCADAVKWMRELGCIEIFRPANQWRIGSYLQTAGLRGERDHSWIHPEALKRSPADADTTQADARSVGLVRVAGRRSAPVVLC